MDGALLINKPAGISSFGVIEELQREYAKRKGIKRRDLPKIGHGGTLDPFATGLLIVCIGRGVKLARYFLGSVKTYEGTIRFGETTIPGDPTDPISERSEVLPESIESIQRLATQLTKQPYLQTPPMHSAKKKDGKPLYELARQGLEVEREPKLCTLYGFDIASYEKPLAKFRLICSSGTYVRTLVQDFARMQGTVGLLQTLHRTRSGSFDIAQAMTVEEVLKATAEGAEWDELPCWRPFHTMLDGYDRAEATQEERDALFQGKQNVLFNILRRAEPGTHGKEHPDCVVIYHSHSLIAIARLQDQAWGLERVFT